MIAAALPAALGASSSGKGLFKSNGCGSCHKLADAGGKGRIGKNLDKAKLNAKKVKKVITNGKGAMPSFESNMSAKEIKTLSAYLVVASRKAKALKKCKKLKGKKKAKCIKKAKRIGKKKKKK